MADYDWDQNPRTTSVSPRIISIISYFWIVGWIVALVLNNPRSEFASFHLRQALGLAILSTAATFVRYAPFMGDPLSKAAALLTFVLWIIGLLAAFRGEQKMVPLLGEQFQQWFKNI